MAFDGPKPHEEVQVLGIDDCMARAMAIPGACRVTLVDCTSGLPIAAAGSTDPVGQDEDAAGTTDIVRAVLASPALSMTRTGDDVAEIIVCGSGGYHLITLVDTAFDGQLFFHLLIDGEHGNLALARHRIQTVIEEMRTS